MELQNKNGELGFDRNPSMLSIQQNVWNLHFIRDKCVVKWPTLWWNRWSTMHFRHYFRSASTMAATDCGDSKNLSTLSMVLNFATASHRFGFRCRGKSSWCRPPPSSERNETENNDKKECIRNISFDYRCSLNSLLHQMVRLSWLQPKCCRQWIFREPKIHRQPVRFQFLRRQCWIWCIDPSTPSGICGTENSERGK